MAATQLQTNNTTYLGRYWNEASVLRRYFSSDAGLSLLSFGCSTGEELATIRLLFPNARLFGCDIDWLNQRAASALLGADAVIFDSSPAAIRAHGPFDIIICNSVLLRPSKVVAGAKAGIPASLWLESISTLDEALAPGGVLQIINSNIPFRFHPLSAAYSVLDSPLVLGPNFADQYDLDGRHLCTGIANSAFSPLLNVHLGEKDWRALEPGDLRHVHFHKAGGRAVEAVLNESILNRSFAKPSASGACTYRPDLAHDPRPATYQEISVEWKTAGAEAVVIERAARRIWFDGQVIETLSSSIDLTGAEAAAFIESAIGRRSTSISLELLSRAPARRTPMI